MKSKPALAAVSIRRLPPEVLRAAKIAAKRNKRSAEAEMRLALIEKFAPAKPEMGLGTALFEFGRKLREEFGDIEIPDMRDRSPARFVKFE